MMERYKWLQSMRKRAGEKIKIGKKGIFEWVFQTVILPSNFIFQNLSAQHKIRCIILREAGWR